MKFSQQYIDFAGAELTHLFPGRHALIVHVGSSYISGSGNDLDLVLLLDEVEGLQDFEEDHDVRALIDGGYTPTGATSGKDDDFVTLRKGDVNVMLTYSHQFCGEFARAAEVCKYVTLLGCELSKESRIKIHRIIMNGEGVD